MIAQKRKQKHDLTSFVNYKLQFLCAHWSDLHTDFVLNSLKCPLYDRPKVFYIRKDSVLVVFPSSGSLCEGLAKCFSEIQNILLDFNQMEHIKRTKHYFWFAEKILLFHGIVLLFVWVNQMGENNSQVFHSSAQNCPIKMFSDTMSKFTVCCLKLRNCAREKYGLKESFCNSPTNGCFS